MIRPGGLADALSIVRTLSRMVEDTPRAATPLLRVSDACNGHLMKYNLSLSRAVAAPVVPKPSPLVVAQPQRASKTDVMVPVQPKAVSPPGSGGTYRSRGAPRSPLARLSETSRQSNYDDRRRRSRSCSRAEDSGRIARVVGKKTRDGRSLAWGAGMDDRGPLRDLCEICYLRTGAHAPRHKGRSCEDLGNPCYLPRRAPGWTEEICHWARNRPNRQQLEGRMRRRFRCTGKNDRYDASAAQFALVLLPSFHVDPEARSLRLDFGWLWFGKAPPPGAGATSCRWGNLRMSDVVLWNSPRNTGPARVVLATRVRTCSALPSVLLLLVFLGPSPFPSLDSVVTNQAK